MTIGEIGSIGGLVGAVATVATLVYLSLQIRANTLAAKQQSLSEFIDRVVQWQARIVSSPESLHSWAEGAKSWHNLDIAEQIRFSSLAVEIFAACEAILESAKFGGIKAETVRAIEGMIHQLLRNKGVQEYWEVSGSKVMAMDFVREVNVIMEASRNDNSDIPGPLPLHMPSVEI